MQKETKYFNLDKKTKDTMLLIGPNGSGKSQSIFYMKLALKKENKHFLDYAASKEDSVRNTERFTGEDHTYSIVQAFKSEGERMVASLSLWFKNEFMPTLAMARQAGQKEMWMFVDELDSGLSYDRIQMELDELLLIQNLERKHGRTLNLVFTANSYEFLIALKNRTDTQIWSVNLGLDLSDKINSFEDFIALYEDRYKELKKGD